MPRLFCIDWSEDDEAFGAREAGWSLHLSREDAIAYTKTHSTVHFGHGQPYLVEVPEAVYEEVRTAPYGVFKSRPRECPYRVVEETFDADKP